MELMAAEPGLAIGYVFSLKLRKIEAGYSPVGERNVARHLGE